MKPEGARQSEAPGRSTGNLMVQYEGNHVVVYHFPLLLEGKHQALLTDAVNHAGNPRGLLRNDVHGLHGEDLGRPFGVFQVGADIALGLRTVQVRDHAVHFNPLPNGGIPLKPELLIPQFRLADKDQGHRAHGIEAVVQQEAEFLKGVLVQEVGFVQHADELLLLLPLDAPDFTLQLVFRRPVKGLPP